VALGGLAIWLAAGSRASASNPPAGSPQSAAAAQQPAPAAAQSAPSPTPAPPAQLVSIVLGISNLSQTDGVAVAPPADPNSQYGTDMLQDQHAMAANGQWSDTPVVGSDRYAEWTINSPGGQYNVVATYAAADSRPVNVSVNGTVVIPNALSLLTGGWNPENRVQYPLGSITLVAGTNVIRISCPAGQSFPHVKALTLTASGGSQ